MQEPLITSSQVNQEAAAVLIEYEKLGQPAVTSYCVFQC